MKQIPEEKNNEITELAMEMQNKLRPQDRTEETT